MLANDASKLAYAAASPWLACKRKYIVLAGSTPRPLDLVCAS